MRMGKPLHLDIPVSVEGEMGDQYPFCAIGNVEIFRFRAAQVCVVEVAALQNFAGLNVDLRSGGFVDFQANRPVISCPRSNTSSPAGVRSSATGAMVSCAVTGRLIRSVSAPFGASQSAAFSGACLAGYRPGAPHRTGWKR